MFNIYIIIFSPLSDLYEVKHIRKKVTRKKKLTKIEKNLVEEKKKKEKKYA